MAVVRPDGSDLRVLLDLPGLDSKPVWSPDGEWLAFESRLVENREIYVVRPDGSDLRNLSNHLALDVGPVWSADGRWIAFESMRSGNRDIFIVQPDGSRLTNISRSPGIDAQPAWSPSIVLAYRPWVLIGAAGVLGMVAVGSNFFTTAAQRAQRESKIRMGRG
jgi:Tol biopolymer transport system component